MNRIIQRRDKMYLEDYMIYIGAMLVCALLSGLASAKVRSAYEKHSHERIRSGMTGYDVAHRLMRSNDVTGISIGCVGEKLSDHYNPANAVVNLSKDTYNSNSVAAVAVAAHEMGHVMQKKDGYLFYNIRTALVPVVNFGCKLSMPLVFIGLLINIFTLVANPDVGFYVAMLGVVLYGGALLFSLATLPVELNASRRAKQMLIAEGILDDDELPGASKVLSAAAFTYVVSILVSLVNFLSLLIRVLSMFGRRND